MKAAPLLIAWHDDKAPIYSAHFEPHGKGRLATAGGDTNVRIWKVESEAEERKVTYLSTLTKHTQAVNVVRWCPRGELLASAGDDGNVLLWIPSDHHGAVFGEDNAEDKETWLVKRMCRSSSGSEVYDLAWSPDGVFFITGSMDNVARIFDASTGNIVRQIAEHNHYVQGVAWDPLNEFLATQSTDRSVHVYKLRTNDGQFSLAQHGKMTKMDMPARRVSSNSPAPPDPSLQAHRGSDSIPPTGSPVPSAPGTPASLALPMNPPPPTTHSRRSSLGNASPSMQRSASPAPSLPLPAVMPSASPNLWASSGARNANLYANETLTSFFRRLTFAPDGSLLFTPAGQYKESNPTAPDTNKPDELTNTVYIYSRGGLNKPPIAHLPGHKKPSVAVRCCPIFFNLRLPTPTKQITIDTSSNEDEIPPLPEPAIPSKPSNSASSMDPPPIVNEISPKVTETEGGAVSNGAPAVFALPYRIVYAVASQDAVYIYDTQQQSPLCVVSNLHFATFTDLTWASDGSTLLISSSDGFCSALCFSAGELGTQYQGSLHARTQAPPGINTSLSSQQSTPIPTPVGSAAAATHPPSSAGFAASPSPVSNSANNAQRPNSPARSNSTSSIATTQSIAQPTSQTAFLNNPTPAFSGLPSVAAAHSGAVTGVAQLSSPTPPMTPLASRARSVSHPGSASFASVTGIASSAASFAKSDESAVLGKREADKATQEASRDGKEPDTKKRRIAPTLVQVSSADGGEDEKPH